MSAHTPGLWYVPDGGLRPTVNGPDGQSIAFLSDTGDEAEANASLIAAAPQMLAALKRIKIVMDGIVHPGCRSPDDSLSEVEAAIAKAEGGAA